MNALTCWACNVNEGEQRCGTCDKRTTGGPMSEQVVSIPNEKLRCSWSGCMNREVLLVDESLGYCEHHASRLRDQITATLTKVRAERVTKTKQPKRSG